MASRTDEMLQLQADVAPAGKIVCCCSPTSCRIQRSATPQDFCCECDMETALKQLRDPVAVCGLICALNEIAKRKDDVGLAVKQESAAKQCSVGFNQSDLEKAFSALVESAKCAAACQKKCNLPGESSDAKPPAKSILLPLSDRKLAELLEDAKDWAQANGLCLRMKDRQDRSDGATIKPFTLLPSPFPEESYNEAFVLQKDFNQLYYNIANNAQFLKASLREVASDDNFIMRLLEIYEKVLTIKGSKKTPHSLLILRSDYMVQGDGQNQELKQVEVNTIASSAACTSAKTLQLHKHLLGKFANGQHFQQHLPQKNDGAEICAEALVTAWRHFGQPNVVMLFVIEDLIANVFDQRALEYEILRQSENKIKIVRKTLAQIGRECKLDAQTRELLIPSDENEEEEAELNDQSEHSTSFSVVSVVYFRAGYVPDHYPTDLEWNARELIELSVATKCPNVAGQLAGTKKVQQILTKPGVVESLLGSKATGKLRATFMPMFGFDDAAETNEAMAVIRANPTDFVLKPQREGGGNNVYGRAALELLEKLSDEEKKSFILMRRIVAAKHKNYIVRPWDDDVKLTDTISEFGPFGYILGQEDHILASNTGGYLFRTKFATCDEAGLLLGAGSLSSPYLL